MEKVDCIVIGAGVVGLAVARSLALDGHEVIVLEAHDCIGSEMSSRNSEVIHAGIYYPRGSLKAGESEHGVAGLINVFGIESPGLTASLALADHVRDLSDSPPKRIS